MNQIYKPNKQNKGYAAKYNFAIDNRSGYNRLVFYVGIVRQYSWDDQSKTGSFKENNNVPDQNINVKFSSTEAAAIYDAIQRLGKWSTYHSSNDGNGAQISISYAQKGENEGFFININRNTNEKFAIALNMAEACEMALYIQAGLMTFFGNFVTTKLNESSNPNSNGYSPRNSAPRSNTRTMPKQDSENNDSSVDDDSNPFESDGAASEEGNPFL